MLAKIILSHQEMDKLYPETCVMKEAGGGTEIYIFLSSISNCKILKIWAFQGANLQYTNIRLSSVCLS